MKTYHTDIRNEYYRDAFIAVDLLELHLKTTQGVSIPWYLNTGGMNINATSSLTGQQVVFTAQGDFLAFSSMAETLDTAVGKFQIQLSGLNLDLVADMVNNQGTEGSKVVIKKAFLNPSTLQLIQSPITVYEGYIFNYAITETAKTATLNISCASLFSDFERTAGRKTNNWSNWLYQGVKYDKAMDKAGYVGNTEFLWGRVSK